MLSLFLELVDEISSPSILVADAYYASRKIILPLLKEGHHLVTRVRITTVAYRPAPRPAVPRRGRPKFYGQKVHLRNLTHSTAFTSAPSPVYGETNVTIQYRCLDLLWRPVGRLVRFVFVKHPTRGSIILLSTNTLLSPLEIVALYGYRFKIEAGFRQAVHVLGSYAYHFWMRAMPPITKKAGNQILYRKSEAYRQAVRRKIHAYHCYVQIGCIAQGLLQHLAVNFSNTVWKQFRSWLRTMKTDQPPSELVVACALRSGLFEFLAATPDEHTLKKLILDHLDPSQLPEYRMAA
jgi:Transposase DDE domain